MCNNCVKDCGANVCIRYFLLIKYRLVCWLTIAPNCWTKASSLDFHLYLQVAFPAHHSGKCTYFSYGHPHGYIQTQGHLRGYYI